MTTIAFIGLGNMGGPMAANLVKAGHRVAASISSKSCGRTRRRPASPIAASAREAVAGADVVITMLPAGRHVIAVWGDILPAGEAGRAVHRLLDHRRRQRAPRPSGGAEAAGMPSSTRRSRAASAARRRAR